MRFLIFIMCFSSAAFATLTEAQIRQLLAEQQAYATAQALALSKANQGGNNKMLEMMMMQQMMQSQAAQQASKSNDKREAQKKQMDENKENPALKVPTPSPAPSNPIKVEDKVDDKDTIALVEQAQKQIDDQKKAYAKEEEADKKARDAAPDDAAFVAPPPMDFGKKTGTTADLKPVDLINQALSQSSRSALKPLGENGQPGNPTGAVLAPQQASIGTPGSGSFSASSGPARGVASTESPKIEAATDVKAALVDHDHPARMRKQQAPTEGESSGGGGEAAASGGGSSMIDEMLAKMMGGANQSAGPIEEEVSPELMQEREAGRDGKPMSVFEIARIRFQYAAYEEKRLRRSKVATKLPGNDGLLGALK